MAEKFVRPEIEGIAEYVPGKAPTKPGVIKLASNENPFGPSPKALEAIAKESKNLHVYPDQKANLLREALAKRFGLSKDNIICGNGSDDIMQILAATYLNPNDEVIISKNTFSVYELVARIFGGKLVFVDLNNFEQDLKAIAAAITPKTKLIFLTNPHNPTGTSFAAKDFDALLKTVPENVLLVVDEAYAEFVESKEFPDSLKHIQEGRNLIVLRTFSKFYGLAGLRVGYGIAQADLIAPMLKAKMPFNVSRLAQAGAAASLNDKDFLDKTLKNNSEGKKYLYAELDKLGLSYKKTEANFIFINIKKSADEFFLKLMAEGVIIRPLSSFGLPQAIRASIGTREQSEKLVAILKKVL
ncbi:histidinol-phosphate transaminase [Candidatus Saganbacteria bacterium]|nr:histidinol-phosphate transaminase [Candidatus Saganbacteria bacterium]